MTNLLTIGILGNGNLGTSLGRSWRAAGHDVVFAGRSSERAALAADRANARAAAIADLGAITDAIVVAIAPDGLEEALTLAGGPDGRLAGLPVIDCTNAVDYSSGRHRRRSGSAAEQVATLAPGAMVVKALHLFAASSWPYTGPPNERPVVSICTDDETALAVAGDLIAALGGVAVSVGSLSEARWLEEVAGFVMRIAASGHNPRYAVPTVDRR